MHVQIGTFWPSAAAYRAAARSQAPRAAAKQQQRQLEATCHFDTPLPIWCMKLPLAPCPSHEREMQVRAGSGAHWSSRGKFDFRLGKVQLACAPHAHGGGSRCHRRTADGRHGAFSSTALQLTLHAAAAWTPRGRGCELHVRSASKSPHFTPWVPDKPLLEALSCLRGIGVPSLPPPYSRIGAASIRPK